MKLSGKVALVTGGSRGVGRGIALGLGEAGATVYLTGRTVQRGAEPEPGTIEHAAREVEARGGRGIPVRCDHADDGAIRALFERIERESGRLDVLVNNVYSGVGDIADTAHRRFFESEPELWDRMNAVGLRSHYVASVHAARMMVRRRSGLLVNVSSFGSLAYLFNAAYGVGKAALDRLTADMAAELAADGVTVLSLWPGFVRTELTSSVLAEATPGYRKIFEAYAEAPIVSGRAVAALAADPDVGRKSGRIVIASEAARRYGVRDEDGGRPLSPRSLRRLARALLPAGLEGWAALVPAINAPMWAIGPVLTRFSANLKSRGGFRRAP